MLTCQAHLKVSVLSCLLDVVYLEIVVFFYDFQGFGSIRSTQPTETHISKMLHFLPNYFFCTIGKNVYKPLRPL